MFSSLMNTVGSAYTASLNHAWMCYHFQLGFFLFQNDRLELKLLVKGQFMLEQGAIQCKLQSMLVILL